MAVLRKFKAIRPKKGLESKIASFPYDVINSEEAREIAKGNKYSFLHINKPEIDLPKGTDLYAEKVYQKAKENFQMFMKEGWFIQDKKEHLYIYRQTMDGREQYGIVGCCSAEDYYNDVIKKHEHTRKAKEEDRIKHIDVTNINAGPIFLTYKAKKSINDIVAVIVENNIIIAESGNRVTAMHDPSAHAEIVAIRKACEQKQHHFLENSVIYCSCEPCPMCLGAIYWAKISKIVFAATRFDAALSGFNDEFIYSELAKDISKRSIQTINLKTDVSREVFEKWKNTEHKLQY